MASTDRVKTTVALDRALWKRARIRAVQEGRDLQDIVAEALVAYLQAPLERSR
jgi:hypothetical protein